MQGGNGDRGWMDGWMVSSGDTAFQSFSSRLRGRKQALDICMTLLQLTEGVLGGFNDRRGYDSSFPVTLAQIEYAYTVCEGGTKAVKQRWSKKNYVFPTCR